MVVISIILILLFCFIFFKGYPIILLVSLACCFFLINITFLLNLSYLQVLSFMFFFFILFRVFLYIGEFFSDALLSFIQPLSRICNDNTINIFNKEFRVIKNFLYCFFIVALLENSSFIQLFLISNNISFEISYYLACLSKVFTLSVLLLIPAFLISFSLDLSLMVLNKYLTLVIVSGRTNAIKLCLILWTLYLGISIIYFKIIEFNL